MESRFIRGAGSRLRRYLITGVITIIPIWITWAAFQFVGKQLAELGAPLVDKIMHALAPHAASAMPRLLAQRVSPWFRTL